MSIILSKYGDYYSVNFVFAGGTGFPACAGTAWEGCATKAATRRFNVDEILRISVLSCCLVWVLWFSAGLLRQERAGEQGLQAADEVGGAAGCYSP